MYRIGRERPRPKTLPGKIGRAFASPFDWLMGQIRGPSEDEILWALKDVSFEVKRGEVVGIIGRNGAGKSTLLKLLSRITEPTTGRAEIHGRVGSLLEVGTGMHPELTGRENIYLNGCTLGMKKAEIDSKFDEIVEFAGVSRFIDTPVKRYSSGMHVRLGFAIAAHLEPEVLIVDEVLAVGDAEFQKKCLGKMKDVAGHGRTVLFVSHNMAAVAQLCSRGEVLSEGRQSFSGLSSEAVSHYLKADRAEMGDVSRRFNYSNSTVSVTRVTVNRTGGEFVHVGPTDRNLEIVLEGTTEAPSRIFMEFRIHGQSNEGLAYYTPRQYRDFAPMQSAGRFSLKETVMLPNLNQGSYYLSIYLGSLDDLSQAWATAENAVSLQVAGHPTELGNCYKYSAGNGLLRLERAISESKGNSE